MVRASISRILAMSLVLASVVPGWAGVGRARKSSPAQATAEIKPVCKVYALAEMGIDAELAAWLVETIPNVIEPLTWHQGTSPKCSVSYFAPTRVMVVLHTPDVHTKLETFIREVTRTTSTRTTSGEGARLKDASSPVVPARYLEKTTNQADGTRSPSAAHSTRHLFHLILEGLDVGEEGFKLKNFTLRYEGEGIIDSTIADLIKTLNRQGVDVEKAVAPLAGALEAAPVLPSAFLPCPPVTMPPVTPPPPGSTVPAGISVPNNMPTTSFPSPTIPAAPQMPPATDGSPVPTRSPVRPMPVPTE